MFLEEIWAAKMKLWGKDIDKLKTPGLRGVKP
jgi:hypothetical protein